MPDWEQAVRERMDGLRLSKSGTHEVIAELAQHVEQQYEALRVGGFAEGEATQRALAVFSDWKQLRVEIEQERKHGMTDGTRKVMLPGTIVFAVSTMFIYSGVALRALHPSQVHWLNSYSFFTINPLLLCGNLASGAVGAYLSLRLGGNRTQRTLTALFPTIIMAAMLGFLFVGGMILRALRIDGAHPSLFIMCSSLLGHFVGIVLIPGACLMAGALPFLFRHGAMRGVAE